MILLSAVTIPRACFDPTSGYKPTHMAQNTGRSLRHQKLNIILTWDTKKWIFSVLGVGGVAGLPLLTTVVPQSHPLENPFRTGDFPVTPPCPCSLTPKQLLQKPRFFLCGHSLWILCGWSRYSDSLATVGGSAATKGAKSHLNAVFFMMHPNKDP